MKLLAPLIFFDTPSYTPFSLIGPFADYLSRRFTSRYVVMFCGVLASLSFISCSLATRPVHLLIPFIVEGKGTMVTENKFWQNEHDECRTSIGTIVY